MMTNQNSLTLNKLFCSLLTSVAIFTFTGSASAAGLGVGAGMGANVGAGAGGNAGMEAGAGAQAEGSAGVNANSSAGDRMSTEGRANQNSQVKPGATRGMERAHERMNGMGSEHEQATDAQATSRRSVKAHHKGKSTAKGKMQQ